MTPEIQELKRLAEAATDGPWKVHTDGSVVAFTEQPLMLSIGRGMFPCDAAYIAAASPSTILALIEVAEAAKGMLAHACIADADPCDVDEEDRALERRLRTALEGVKK